MKFLKNLVEETVYKLSFYVPDSHLESVKQALFRSGAGRLGNYQQCCWQSLGKGQFRPMPGSHPFLGGVGDLEVVEEWKVEMIVPHEKAHQVISALRLAHPYEEPAFTLIRLEQLPVSHSPA